MRAWLRKFGSDVYLVDIQKGKEGEGRIVSVSENVKDGQRILFVPVSVMMTSASAQSSSIGKRIRDSGCTVKSSHTWLAAHLMEEKRKQKQSRFFQYTCSLPKRFDNMPINFTTEQKHLLKGSSSLEQVKAMSNELRQEYSTLVEHVKGFDYSFEVFVWARLCVLTRAFAIEKNGRPMDALVPVADMLNHSNNPTVSWYYDNSQKGFVITAEKGINKGTEVFDSYGIKSQRRFFVNYGFTIDRNIFKHNQAVITVTLSSLDPAYKHKLPRIGTGAGGRDASARFTVSPGYRSRGVGRMLSYCRFVTAKQEELNKAPDKFARPQEVGIISIPSEIRALKRLEQSTLQALSMFPDPLHSDHKALKTNVFRNANDRNCMVMRASEKEVLHWFVGFCRAMCDLYRRLSSETTAESRIATFNKMHKITWRKVLGHKWMQSYKDYIDDAVEELIFEP